jgi:hypothetical protein
MRELDPEVVGRLIGLSMDVWAEWWTAVGLPEREEFGKVELLRMTWPEN